MTALYQLLNDKYPYDGPIYSLLHVAEKFEKGKYIAELVSNSKDWIVRSPKWASIIFMRVLNNEDYRKELSVQLLGATPQQKNIIRTLMESINEQGVEFVAKTVPVIASTK